METDLFDHIDTMLETVQDEVADPDLAFKLRTARQTLVVIEEQYTAGQKALKEAEIDEETLESLRQLGYLNSEQT